MCRTHVLIAAALATTWTTCCTVRVVGDLEETQANRVVMALEQASIPASKVREKQGRKVAWAVRVGSAEAPRARQVLESLSLPRPEHEGFESIVSEESIVPSASRERLKESVARGREIARTLETLEDVVEASVIIAPPDQPPPGAADGERAAGTASALIKARGDLPVSERDLAALIAGAVRGVEPDGVTVVVAQAPRPEAGQLEWASVGPFVVSPSTRTPLVVTLTLMALMNIVLGAWAVSTVVRARRARRRSGGSKAQAPA
jgi:type III secretory pathway lipoprotein EscJ